MQKYFILKKLSFNDVYKPLLHFVVGDFLSNNVNDKVFGTTILIFITHFLHPKTYIYNKDTWLKNILNSL